MLDIRIHQPDALEITLSGSLCFEDYPAFREVLAAVERFQGNRVVLDLSYMDVTDPAGIAMLMLLNDTLERRSLWLFLTRVSQTTEKVFTLARLRSLETRFD